MPTGARAAATVLLFGLLSLGGTASAVPVGTGLLTVEVQGVPGDNVSCTRGYGFANQPYDVFGTTVNLSTDLVEIVCTGGAIAGVNQVGHCQSYPSDAIFAFDVRATTVCSNPPGCGQVSFVTDRAFNVTGTLPATIGSGVVYTADGQITATGGLPNPTIPGCPIVGAVMQFNGTVGLNAFQGESTPVGSNQTVSFPDTTFFNPLTGQQVQINVGITFSQVTGAGTTTVTASSNVAGEIPSNFAFAVNGFNAAFLEVTTTATVVPPIEICSAYDDGDNDGFVDGTSPAVPEAALSFLHGAGDPPVFVDRTSSRDPVNNVICAQVDSLSPFAVLVRTNGICAAPDDPCDDGDACTIDDYCTAGLECVGGGSATCNDGSVCTADVCQSPLGCTYPPAPAAGCVTGNAKSLLLVRNDANDGRDQVLFKWLKGTIPIGDFGDPTASAGTYYTLCAFDANKMLVSATAPAAAACGTKPCWSFTGPAATPTGVKFNDPARANQGVKLVKGKAGTSGKGLLLFKALGADVPPIDLAGIVYPVTVQVRASDAACWEQQFTSGDEKKNAATLFKAVHVNP